MGAFAVYNTPRLFPQRICSRPIRLPNVGAMQFVSGASIVGMLNNPDSPLISCFLDASEKRGLLFIGESVWRRVRAPAGTLASTIDRGLWLTNRPVTSTRFQQDISNAG